MKVDILHRRHDGRLRLIEVKSTTDAKDHHFEDVAIQYRVVSRSGVDVAIRVLGARQPKLRLSGRRAIDPYVSFAFGT